MLTALTFLQPAQHPDVLELINHLLECPTDDLAAFIAAIPEWRWPRSDLYAWIKVLNKFDTILEDIIREYDIEKLQVNAYTPLTKATLLEILRFERMLLENSTSRKLFASYDRLNSLLFSSDLDVLVASLKVILRPAQQYSSQPPSAHTSNISSARLQALAQSWSVLREHGVELHDLLDSSKSQADIDLTGEAGDINFQFYRKPAEKPKDSTKPGPAAPVTAPLTETAEASSSNPSASTSQAPQASKSHPSGLNAIHLTNVATSPKEPMQLLAEVVEEHDLPDEEKFALLCKIRIIKSLTKEGKEDRDKLNAARLYAIAIFAHTHTDSQANSSIFLYDPELVTHVAELIHPDRAISTEVQIAALTALDGLGRYRSRIGEVLSAVNAGVSHGSLLSLLRRTVAQLTDPSAKVNNEFSETLFALLSLLTSTPGGGTAIVGAGLIPLLVQVIEAKVPGRLSIVSKTLALLDNVLYVFANAFQLFCNSRGVDVLVERIEYEVNYNIENHKDESDVTPAVSSYGRLEYARSSLLKHLLRSMHRMMQASGSAEGLRTLIDSSLPASIKKIMANRIVFGPPIFSISINLMSIFIHNEPTSLTILQEAHIPETLFDAIESGIEPALEVISALPNAIGALCLNAAGEAQLAARTNIIPSIFATFTSEKHLKVMGDKDNAMMIGSSIDELVRHHPTLKPMVFEAIQKMLQSIEEMGKTWTPKAGDESHYGLTVIPTSEPSDTAEPMVVTMENAPASEEPVAGPSTSAPTPIPVVGQEPSIEEEAKKESAPGDNIVLNFMDIAVKFLEGFFQHAPHCRDFVLRHDGVECLGRLLKLPSLPIRFSESVPAESFIQTFRTMAELVPKETLSRLSLLVRSSLDETRELWDTMGTDAKLSRFTNVQSDSDLAEVNKDFRKLLGLQNTVGLIADVYQTAGYSHTRSASALLQVLNGTDAPEIIGDLGKLHRAFVWESIVIKASQPSQSSPSRDNAESTETNAMVDVTETPDVNVAPQPPISQGSDETTGARESASNMNANEKAVKYIVGLIPTSLTPFFQAIVKMCMFNRRSSDNTLKNQAFELANRVSKVLLDHCLWVGDGSKLSYAYSSLVVSLIAVLFCDERTSQNNLHTLLVVVFQRCGGIDATLSMGQRCIDCINRLVIIPRESHTPDTEKELAYAFSALNVIVHLLHMLVSSKPLLESPQTQPLITRDKPQTDPTYFEPHQFLVKMRLAALPLLLQVWQSSWLSSAPLPALKSIIRTMVEIAAAENEEGKADGSAPPGVTLLSAITAQIRPGPDEASVTQLVDMGFPRSSVERALAQSRNNVNGAAELLLNHPYLFVNANAIPLGEVGEPADDDDDEPAPPPVQVPVPEPEPEAVAVDVDVPPPTTEDAPAAQADTAPAEEADLTELMDTGPGPSALFHPEDSSDEDETPDAPSTPPVVRDWKAELDVARQGLKVEVAHRALKLVDQHPGLVFEAKTAFVRVGRQEVDYSVLVSLLIPEEGPNAANEGVNEEILVTRCRLLALILNDPIFSSSTLPDAQAEALMNALTVLLHQAEEPVAVQKVPKWMAPHLLAVEALFILGEGITTVKVPSSDQPVPTADLYTGPQYEEARTLVFNWCLKLLAVEVLSRDEMLATLRLLVLLTRNHKFSIDLVQQKGINLLLDRFKTPSKDVLAYRPLVFIIIRHIIEDFTTVQSIVQHNLKRYFQVARTRAVEVGTLIRNTGPLVLRDPQAFIAACQASCKLSLSRSSSGQTITLKGEEPAPAQQKPAEQDVASSSNAMVIDETPKPEPISPQLSDTLIHYLMTELLRVGKAAVAAPPPASSSPSKQAPPTAQGEGNITAPSEQLPESSNAPPTPTSDVESSDYLFACVIMQCLAELLSSYNSCKLSFVNYHKKRTPSVAGGPHHKHRSSVLNFLLVEVLSSNSGPPGTDVQKKASLSTWATSVVVSLCTDVSFGSSSKDASDELAGVRKFVLDALARTIKEIPPTDPPENRYVKLFALADLCYRLLTPRQPQAPGAKEDTTIQIAKIMLEKNFVAILTGALVDADLNYPGMKTLVGVIMRPLEHLTKVAIKMGRASGRPKEGQVDAMETESVDSSDDDDEDGPGGSGREDTPDLYRHSALGIFGGDMEEVEYNGQDEDGMDEDEDEDNAEMDYDDDDTSGTEESSEGEDVEHTEHVELEMGIQAPGGNDWEDEMEQDEADGSEDHDEDDDQSEPDAADGEEEMPWQPDGNDGLAEGGIPVQPGEDDEEPIEDLAVVEEDDGEEEGDASTEEEFVAHNPLELDDIGPNDDEFAWGAEAMPWNAVTGHDFGGIRHGLATAAVARRARQPDFVNAEPYAFLTSRRVGPVFDPAAHPLLVETPNQNAPEANVPYLRGSHRRLGHGGVLTSGVNYTDLVQTIQHLVGGEGAQLLQQLITHGRDVGADLHLAMAPDGGALLGSLGRGQLHHHHPPGSAHIHRSDRRSRSQSLDAAQFPHQTTLQRWAEEAKFSHSKLAGERLAKITNHVVIALLPASREAAKVAKAEQERLAAEEKVRVEQQQKEQEAKEEQDRLQRAREEEAAAAQAATAQAAEVQAAEQVPAIPPPDEDVVMADATPNVPDNSQDVQAAEPSETVNTVEAEPVNAEPVAAAEASSSIAAEPARITVLVHGNPVDITDTGIDPTFLEALPDEMREEVINQHFRERRFAAQAERPADSHISPEFLAALPDDIRAELLQQEIAEQTRQQRAQATRNDAPSGPSDMDPASFLASLDPQLRHAVLLDQDDGFLQTLPSAMIAEANMIRVQTRGLGRVDPQVLDDAPRPPPSIPRKAIASRDAVQLLDKNGVAALVRLLFFPQAPKRSSLHKVLVNLCENGKTRTELLNILLTILQTGTADMSAVDKSFSQMSVRPNKNQTPKATPRSKTTIEGTLPFPILSSDTIPNLAAQRCLEALTSIVHANEQSSIFFLTEHELPAGLKRGASRKGKGKEKQTVQSHFPIVLLLGLLDKSTVLKTPSMMDAVVALLSSVTRPLISLKDDGEKPNEKSPIAGPSNTGVPDTTAPPSVPNPPTDADAEGAPSVVSPAQDTAKNVPAAKLEELPPKLLPVPPQIPHSVLRLVVNILTMGECSARTFQHTLSLIQNLSHLPDARDHIATELRSKAQEFGHALYNDLDNFTAVLQSSDSGDAVPSAAISKFSSASSDQAKFLRVLKTIDYMYSSKQPSLPITRPSPNPSSSSQTDQEKVQSIYEAFRFGSLWRRLGDCLKIVAEKSDMEHVATVLLPLIESLMVVCKYATSDGPQQRALRASASPRSPTSSREVVGNLFVTFTDEHRKILNVMVRNNPSLMSGSFSLLVQNPRVLDFDNKRNYFNQKLRRRPSNRDHFGTLQVNVRRPRVFEDSFQHLQRFTGDQIKYGKLSVRFYDEEGVDAGGVTREWFQILARQMFNPDYALFQPCAADKLTYQPNQASYINSEHLAFFKFVGRIIGKAIYDGRLLDAYFARSLYRQMLGKPVDYRDVEWVDPEYYNSLCWILENDPTILDLTFSVEANAFGLTKVVALKENGISIPVTNENKREYVQLSAEYRLVSSIKDQIDAFLSGFYDIIQKDLISIFNEQELELLISGTPDIDVDEWRAATDYTGYTPSDPAIVWWWRALKSFTRDERAKVLSFATGTSKVPLGGFVDLQGVQGVQRFSIHKAYGDPDRLPQAHTCFNQIDLPQYTSYEKMRTQLLLAINEGGEGFGFA